jgi:hypothetical protein
MTSQVHSASQMTSLLYLEIGLAVLPVLCVFVYYPSKPSQPPSTAAATVDEQATFEPRSTDLYKTLSKTPSGVVGVTGNTDPSGMHSTDADDATDVTAVGFRAHIPHLLNRSFICLIVAGGLNMGVYARCSFLNRKFRSRSSIRFTILLGLKRAYVGSNKIDASRV